MFEGLVVAEEAPLVWGAPQVERQYEEANAKQNRKIHYDFSQNKLGITIHCNRMRTRIYFSIVYIHYKSVLINK